MPSLATEAGTRSPRSNAVPVTQSIQARAKDRAQSLALLSLGLGLAEAVVPRRVSQMVGIKPTERTNTLIRLIGLREIATGSVLLRNPSSSWAMWSRVAGDVLDLSLLAYSAAQPRSSKWRGTLSGLALVGVTILDVLSSARLSPRHAVKKLGLPIHVRQSVIVNQPPYDVYRFWRDFTNLPRFMSHLESVSTSNGRSLWKARGPIGTSVEWEAEILHDRPGESIAWRSVDDTLVPNRGVVRFKPVNDGRATEVDVELKYEPPGGIWGATIAKLFGEEPAQQIAEDLQHLKYVLENQ